MYSLTVEFSSQTEIKGGLEGIWKRLGITGEIELRPADNGRWILEIHSERKIRESALKGLNGRIIEG
ncbi:MAG: hypothetical protein AB1331_00960 [Bacillota bacterium]